MSFLDRFRKPTKYILQTKKDKKLEDVTEYTAKDYPTPPTLSALAGDMDDQDAYYRLVAVYSSGATKIIDEQKATRKKTRTGEINWDDFERGVDDALKPITKIANILEKINKSLEAFRGDELTADQVREIVREESGGGSGDFWEGMKAPGWMMMFHPALRQAQKDLFKDIEDMVTNIGERIGKSMMEEATGLPSAEDVTQGPSLDSILNEELQKSKQKTQEAAKDKPQEGQEEKVEGAKEDEQTGDEDTADNEKA